jgi:predicted transposase/invertase (TIGR01784 family)
MASQSKRSKPKSSTQKLSPDSDDQSVHHIHDYGYKRLFSNVVIFRQLLETFVDQPWVKELDFNKAETINHSFISEDYKKTESDIIYKLKLKNGKDAYIYVLLEFQSTVDQYISVRMLNYITSLYLNMIHNQKIKKKKLPPVFPILLYNGDPKWTAPDTIAELIENHDVLGDYGIGFKYLKIIENEYTYEHLLQIQNIVSTIFLTENHYRLEQLEQELLTLFKKEDRKAASLFFNWFRMLAKDGRIDLTDYNAFEKIYTDITEVKRMFATAVNQKDKRLIKEGEAKGRAETLAEAEAKIRQEKEKMALQMIADGIPLDRISKYTGLSTKELQKLGKKKTSAPPKA